MLQEGFEQEHPPHQHHQMLLGTPLLLPLTVAVPQIEAGTYWVASALAASFCAVTAGQSSHEQSSCG